MGSGVGRFSAALAHYGIPGDIVAGSIVFFNETAGAVLIILGLFTRPIAASIAIEFAVITFVAHWHNGFTWTNPHGGWEYPFLWGLIYFAVALRGGGPYSLDRKIGREV
jgi:putative oxidoreductase